jgi:hypothetical protein
MEELKPELVAHIVFAARRLNADGDIREALRDMSDDDVGQEPVSLDEARIGETKRKEHERDPVFQDIKGMIEDLPVDAQCELIALAWMGRDDGLVDDWNELLTMAQDRHSDHTAEYLIAMPLLGDYLDYGLEAFGHQLEDFEDEHG